MIVSRVVSKYKDFCKQPRSVNLVSRVPCMKPLINYFSDALNTEWIVKGHPDVHAGESERGRFLYVHVAFKIAACQALIETHSDNTEQPDSFDWQWLATCIAS